jgi:hypothetical protein
MTEANTPPRARIDPDLLARIEAQHRERVLWHRAAGLGDRVSVGCPYDPERTEPDNRVYVVTINAAGELVYTLEDADAFAAERLAAERLAALRRRDAQRDAQRDASGS